MHSDTFFVPSNNPKSFFLVSGLCETSQFFMGEDWGRFYIDGFGQVG